MLAPYPDRLKSSRSSPAQGNASSTSTPSPPPPNAAPPPSSASHHKLFSSRSNLPLTRMRTNSLSSPSPSLVETPSSSTDFVVPTSLRNATRRPHRPARPSTSSGIPDQKSPAVPIAVTSPGASAVTVSILSSRDISSLVHYFQFKAICRFYAQSQKKHQEVPFFTQRWRCSHAANSHVWEHPRGPSTERRSFLYS